MVSNSVRALFTRHGVARPKAKVAAARKLLINCYVMLRDGIGYEEFTRRGEVGLCEWSGEVKRDLQSLSA